ncbi:plasmodesmata-located protein 3-like [Hordeum vulgare subsp. vulgare]|uniref:plasmodesmata-located protein 3-like n=1 Tax=Hordeum vulgare subsp. vulgare TaxID=112509 RepID=UPI001D1A4987|nr:plasmodesmata-located protein 3-like [Hordeum vulgare subsp. vulgare]
MGAGGLLLLAAAAVLALILSTAPRPASCADLYAVVYKGRANQTFPAGSPPPTVAALSSALAAQSASAKFYKTSSSSASSSSASVFGLFQCRDDLSGPDCSSCVARAMSSWRDLCGTAVAARVQLNGCLALYEISGLPQVSGVQMLFKTCGSGAATDFETRPGHARTSPPRRARPECSASPATRLLRAAEPCGGLGWVGDRIREERGRGTGVSSRGLAYEKPQVPKYHYEKPICQNSIHLKKFMPRYHYELNETSR